jgi:O-antigen/teichoic acid export membrane protein
MTERRSILANLSALVAGQVIAMTLGLITHAILARAVGPADYGLLGFAVAVMSYFGVAASLGTDTWAMREIAADRRHIRDTASDVVALRLALSLIAAAGVIVLVVLWKRPAPGGTVLLIQAVSLFTAAITLDFAFQGLERMDAAARRQVTTAVIALAGIAAVLGLGGGIVAAAIALQAAAFVAAAIMVGEFAATAGLRLSPRISAWPRILRDSAPLAVTGLVTTIYMSIDIVMLEALRPGDDVGYYVAAARLMLMGLAVAAVFRSAFSPVLARLMGDAPARREAGRHHAGAVAAIGGLGALLGFVLAPDILNIVYGGAFLPAVTVFRILMANLLIAFAVEVFHTQLVAWRLQTAQMWIMVAGAVINVALNLMLIPRYGMEGAAIATLASTVLVLVLASVALTRAGFELHLAAMAKAGMIAAAVAFIGTESEWMMAESSQVIRLFVLGSVLAAIYAALAWAARVVRPRETIAYFTRA